LSGIWYSLGRVFQQRADDGEIAELTQLVYVVKSVMLGLNHKLMGCEFTTPKKYIMYNHPKMSVGDLCLYGLMSDNRIRHDLTWTLLDNLRLHDIPNPFLLVVKVSSGTGDKRRHKVVESYVDVRLALKECRRHGGRLIVVINRNSPRYGWYPHGEYVTGKDFLHITNNNTIKIFRG
jgi:hypothetical protein